MFSAGLFPLPTPPSKQHGRLLRESCYFMTKPLSLPGGEESFVRGGRLWALGTGGDARVSSPLSGTRHLPTISSTASFWLGKCLSSAELFMRVCSTWWAWAHPQAICTAWGYCDPKVKLRSLLPKKARRWRATIGKSE